MKPIYSIRATEQSIAEINRDIRAQMDQPLDTRNFMIIESLLEERERLEADGGDRMKLPEIFTTNICPRCHQVMAAFDRWGQGYISTDMDAAAISDMRCEGYFGLSAPVLLIDGAYHGPKEFFDGDKLDEMKLKELIG